MIPFAKYAFNPNTFDPFLAFLKRTVRQIAKMDVQKLERMMLEGRGQEAKDIMLDKLIKNFSSLENLAKDTRRPELVREWARTLSSKVKDANQMAKLRKSLEKNFEEKIKPGEFVNQVKAFKKAKTADDFVKLILES